MMIYWARDPLRTVLRYWPSRGLCGIRVSPGTSPTGREVKAPSAGSVDDVVVLGGRWRRIVAQARGGRGGYAEMAEDPLGHLGLLDQGHQPEAPPQQVWATYFASKASSTFPGPGPPIAE